MNYLLTVLCTLCVVLSFSQEKDTSACSNYKTGSFYVISGADTCYIRRTEDRQYERCRQDEEELELIIVWLNDNKYILRDIQYNPTTAQRVMRNDVIMTILETTENYHIVHAKKKGKGKQILKVYCNK